MNKLIIFQNTLLNFILLVRVVEPIVEDNDTVFYISCGLFFIAALALAVSVVYGVKKNRRQYQLSLIDDTNSFYNLFAISIAGLLVDYSVGLHKEALFWWMVIAADVVVLILSMRMRRMSDETDKQAGPKF